MNGRETFIDTCCPTKVELAEFPLGHSGAQLTHAGGRLYILGRRAELDERWRVFVYDISQSDRSRYVTEATIPHGTGRLVVHHNDLWVAAGGAGVYRYELNVGSR